MATNKRIGLCNTRRVSLLHRRSLNGLYGDLDYFFFGFCFAQTNSSEKIQIQGLLRRLGARSRCFCCLDPIPPTEGGGRRTQTRPVAFFSTDCLSHKKVVCRFYYEPMGHNYLKKRQALVSWVLFEGALVASVTRWPLRGREKLNRDVDVRR